MNRYFFVRRLTGPAILLLLGIVALLNQAHVANWSLFVPLLLILLGVLKLAERAVLASEPNPYNYPYPPYSDVPYGAPPAEGTGSPYGGQSASPIAPGHIKGSAEEGGTQ